jgi:peroxiredoxin Q/BCP
MQMYGAFGERKMAGKVSMGVIRSTVLVGPDGQVIKHWKQVDNAAEHPREVLEILRKTGKSA